MKKQVAKPEITLRRGDVFNTEFESGCVVITTPDLDGNFDALDSDGVRCGFNVRMVKEVRS